MRTLLQTHLVMNKYCYNDTKQETHWKSHINMGGCTTPAAAWKVNATAGDISDGRGSETSEKCQESG